MDMDWHREQMDKQMAWHNEAMERRLNWSNDRQDQTMAWHNEQMAKMHRHAWIMFGLGVINGVVWLICFSQAFQR